VGNSCQSYWQRTLWDGDQILYEWRTPDGTSTGMNSGYAGYVHVEGLDQPLGLIRSDGTRVLNYTWRGLGESSVFTNGAAGDASITSGLPAVDWPTRTQGAVYFTPNVLASGPSGPFTWFGTLAENGAGSTGLLYKRNRYFDPASGRFTQADPIGLGGGLNLYGFANGDPVNYSDPFGLCPVCDVADVGFFAHSAYKAWKNPSRETFEDLALDGLGLLPVIPSVGMIRRLENLADGASAGRKLWEVTSEGTDRVVKAGNHTYSRHKSTGLFWSRDAAGHGQSAWKVYEQRADGLHWLADADKYGDFIKGKHKSPAGTFIPTRDLNTVR